MDPAANIVFFDKPGVASVRWDEDGKLVLVEWQGWANPSEFAALLEAEIVALRKHKGSRMLADCRRQKGLSAADQDRANEVWLPRALAAGLKRFAVVVPSSGLAEANLKERLGKVRAQALEVAYFPTPEEARDWLGG
jgi:SpoIIAA-like